MRQVTFAVGLAALCWWAVPVHAAIPKCPPDSVRVGDACIDKYEESVWLIDPVNNPGLVNKVQAGKATLADLTAGGTLAAIQLGPANACGGVGPGGNYGANFPFTGNWSPIEGSNPPSPGVYAVSIPGVMPSACLSWFQANQACALSGKRLVGNEEWQRAAAGTPDPGTDNGTTDCNVGTLFPGNAVGGSPVNTGSRSNCKSAWGVFDMVGNMYEWVADWGDLAPGATNWTAAAGLPGGDESFFGGPGGGCFGTPDDCSVPGALMRGGNFEGFGGSTYAGVFAVSAMADPTWSDTTSDIGFRCAR